jgi:outer membrane protein OmpA-like peptidoglycan-associated protein/tetratricopeptide (TPR) repeat protein
MKAHLLKIIMLVLLVNNPLLAQETVVEEGKAKTENNKADKMYNRLGYQEAIEMYRDGKLSQEAMEKIANGYRLNHDTQNAEKWYAQIVDSASDPIIHLYYAQALHSNGNLAKAKEHYLKYDAFMGRNNDARGMRLAEAIDRAIEFEPSKEVEVENAWALNSNMLDFSPSYMDGGIVFVSNRQAEVAGRKKDLWTGDDYNTLFYSEKNSEGKQAEPELFSLKLADRFHEGPVAFSKSSDQVFFTKNLTKKTKNKEYILKIYTAFNNSGVWGEQGQLDLGDGVSNDAHPTLSPDGQKLYFASDREGGFGGMDLYVSTFSAGKWSSPENLGSTINTPGNELFPFIYDDGTLYFASDGWGGLGGLDNFYVEKKDEFSWGEAINLDKPFNSNKDDFGYILNVTGTEGYFTSAREDGLGKDDIYSFKLKNPQGNKKPSAPKLFASICTFDEGTGERLPDVKINVLAQADDGSFMGFEEDFLMSLKPTNVEGEYTLTVKRRDPFDDGENSSYTSDANGQFSMNYKPSRKYVLVGKMDGYKESRQEVTAENLANGEFCIPMTPAQCISLRGIVTNRKFGNPIPNATVTLVDLCTGETEEVRADAGGNYQFPCLPCGCDFVVRGTKANFKEDNGLASTVDMSCEGMETLTQDLKLLPPSISPDGEFVTYDNNPNTNTSPYPKTEDYNPYDYSNPNPTNDGVYSGGVNTSPAGELPRSAEEMLENGITIELKDIYYDFDKYNIRNWDAQPDLDKVVAVMRRHPDIHIALGSHTDSRASDAYNDELSENRAKSAKQYIIAKGIESHRITARGFGENQLVNRCSDGVECTEDEHQANRRTEVRISKGRID